MGTQDKFGETLSEFIAPGLFQDARKARHPANNGAAAVAVGLNSKGRAFSKSPGRACCRGFDPAILFLFEEHR